MPRVGRAVSGVPRVPRMGRVVSGVLRVPRVGRAVSGVLRVPRVGRALSGSPSYAPGRVRPVLGAAEWVVFDSRSDSRPHGIVENVSNDHVRDLSGPKHPLVVPLLPQLRHVQLQPKDERRSLLGELHESTKVGVRASFDEEMDMVRHEAVREDLKVLVDARTLYLQECGTHSLSRHEKTSTTVSGESQ